MRCARKFSRSVVHNGISDLTHVNTLCLQLNFFREAGIVAQMNWVLLCEHGEMFIFVRMTFTFNIVRSPIQAGLE